MLCNTSRTGLPVECHVFTIEPVFPKATVIGKVLVKVARKDFSEPTGDSDSITAKQ
jgi:hypothetical protein